MKLSVVALSLLLFSLACQSQARRSSKRSHLVPDRGLGPIVETDSGTPDPVVTPGKDSKDSEPAGPVVDPVLPGKPKPGGVETPVIGDVALKDNPNLPFGLLALTDQRPSIIISRTQYVLSWNQDTRSVNWAAWKLDKSNFGDTERSENFAVDSELNKALAGTDRKVPSSTDYNGSCFDRGHMVPSADRTDSVANNEATFLMSNIIPQTAFLNRMVWEPLETHARNLIRQKKNEQLWIVAGPIYKKTLRYTGKKRDIAVPDFTFKVIFTWDPEAAERKAELITAVIMPNVTSLGTDPIDDRETLCSEVSGKVAPDGPTRETSAYSVDLEQVEREAALEFFP